MFGSKRYFFLNCVEKYYIYIIEDTVKISSSFCTFMHNNCLVREPAMTIYAPRSSLFGGFGKNTVVTINEWGKCHRNKTNVFNTFAENVSHVSSIGEIYENSCLSTRRLEYFIEMFRAPSVAHGHFSCKVTKLVSF